MTKKLSKTDINFWIDTFLLINFLVLCWSTVILRYAFPAPTHTAGWRLWGLDYLAWTDVQFFTLAILAAAVLLHVMMHWSWVCGVVAGWRRNRQASPVAKHDSGSRTLWGVSLLIVIFNVLGLGIAAALLTIREPLP